MLSWEGEGRGAFWGASVVDGSLSSAGAATGIAVPCSKSVSLPNPPTCLATPTLQPHLRDPHAAGRRPLAGQCGGPRDCSLLDR